MTFWDDSKNANVTMNVPIGTTLSTGVQNDGSGFFMTNEVQTTTTGTGSWFGASLSTGSGSLALINQATLTSTTDPIATQAATNTADIASNAAAITTNTADIATTQQAVADEVNARVAGDRHLQEQIDNFAADVTQQFQAADARTLQQANAYTDKRVNQMAAAGMAALQSAASAPADGLGVGLGSAGGQGAVAFPLKRALAGQVMFTASAAHSGGKTVIGMGWGVHW